MTELKNAEHFKEREIYALVLQNSEYIIILKRSEEQQQKNPKWKTVSVKHDEEVSFIPSTQGFIIREALMDL